MKKIIFPIVVTAILGASGYFLWGRSDTPTDLQKSEVNQYTMEEIATHNTKEDCWQLYGTKVYDVTKAFEKHGMESLLMGCGKESTYLFETREMGSGTPHSDLARKLLEKYYIGELKQ